MSVGSGVYTFGDGATYFMSQGVVNPGGIMLECGEFSWTEDNNYESVQTRLKSLIGGLCFGDSTNSIVGRAKSICMVSTGSAVIEWTCSDSTVGSKKMTYMAFGT